MLAKKSVAARFPSLPTRLLGMSRHSLRRYISALSDKGPDVMFSPSLHLRNVVPPNYLLGGC